MPKPQPSSDALLHAAADALGGLRQQSLGQFRDVADHPLAELYRVVMRRQTGPHKRTQVVPANAVDVQDECVGLSQDSKRRAFCSASTPASVALVRIVRESVPGQLRDFSFSTMQINVGLRPKPHRDAANAGASLTVSLGPFTGGLLWQATTQ